MEDHNDDIPVGRLLSRREALTLLAAASAAMLVGCAPGASSSPQSTTTAGLNAEAATAVASAQAQPGINTTATNAPEVAAAGTATLPQCIVSPEQTEGPYFADVQLNRSDIRSDPASGTVKEGQPLALTMRVSQISSNGCTPLEGALVDIWHCDATGVYSSFQGEGTADQKFLRGYQVTDAQGTVRFTTIYPGWYQGRTIHIHFKVRTDPDAGQGQEFTSQLYFDDAISDQVLAQAPYAGRSGQRDTTNANDGIYRRDGDRLTIAVIQADQGYTGTFDVGLQMA